MCLRRAPEKYITGAALDRAALDYSWAVCSKIQLATSIHSCSLYAASRLASQSGHYGLGDFQYTGFENCVSGWVYT
jgi:hypothetical protein